jgi:DNA-directed RNA polymerase specialized sigma24 family protein
MELAARAKGGLDVRRDARVPRRGHVTGARFGRGRARATAAHTSCEIDAGTTPRLEDLWVVHGERLYRLACALLGDEAAAVQTVTRAMVDLARMPVGEWPEDLRRYLAGRVYWRSAEVSSQPPDLSRLPPVMTWLAQLAQLQRACLALCVFGDLTHREAADLLHVAPTTVAELLTAGLRELRHLAAGGPTTA